MIQIRQATKADLPLLIPLYEELQDKGPDLSKLSFSDRDRELSAEAFCSLAKYPDYRVFIAQADTQIVGTLALLILDSVPNGVPSGLVENLVVMRPWRRKGVGRQLMEFAVELCRSRGCFELTLSSRLENQAAHRFYESLGLRKKGFVFSLKTLPERERRKEWS